MPTSFKTIDAVDVAGKRVLVRVDLNVPMKNGKVTDATRIERAAPTLGQDNQNVLETILGYSPERIAALTAADVLR